MHILSKHVAIEFSAQDVFQELPSPGTLIVKKLESQKFQNLWEQDNS
jgi:hypothetical protein